MPCNSTLGLEPPSSIRAGKDPMEARPGPSLPPADHRVLRPVGPFAAREEATPRGPRSTAPVTASATTKSTRRVPVVALQKSALPRRHGPGLRGLARDPPGGRAGRAHPRHRRFRAPAAASGSNQGLPTHALRRAISRCLRCLATPHGAPGMTRTCDARFRNRIAPVRPVTTRHIWAVQRTSTLFPVACGLGNRWNLIPKYSKNRPARPPGLVPHRYLREAFVRNDLRIRMPSPEA